MVGIQLDFLVAILIVICVVHRSSPAPSSSNGGKDVKDQFSCLTREIGLPGAHYVKAVGPAGSTKKAIKRKSGAHNFFPSIAIIGNVEIVLRGAMGHQGEWAVNTVGIAGIGAATLNGWSAVGETIFVNGMAIIRQTDNGTADYYKTSTSDKFRTQFSAFVTRGAEKNGDFMVNYPMSGDKIKTPLANFPVNGSMFISQFYSRLYTAVGRHPYCYVGLAQFAKFRAIALSLAPVYDEPLFGENKKKYYAKPVEKLSDTFALIVGCAANYLDLEDKPKLMAKMKLLLYKNPFDKGRPKAEFHSHAVTLKRCVTSVDQIEVEDIGEAFHMVNTARIKAATVQVYVLKSADQIVQINDTEGNGGPQAEYIKHIDSIPSGVNGIGNDAETQTDGSNTVAEEVGSKNRTAPGLDTKEADPGLDNGGGKNRASSRFRKPRPPNNDPTKEELGRGIGKNDHNAEDNDYQKDKGNVTRKTKKKNGSDKVNVKKTLNPDEDDRKRDKKGQEEDVNQIKYYEKKGEGKNSKRGW